MPIPNMTLKAKIEGILNRFDPLQLECDGFTRVASYALTQANIPHQVFGGTITVGKKTFPLHFWIKAGGWTVDYRARMWFGPKAPHGVFMPPNNVAYDGEPTEMGCNPLIFSILTNGMEALP